MENSEKICMQKQNYRGKGNRLYDHIEFDGLDAKELELFKMAQKGDARMMLELLMNGLNPDAKTEDDTTALMVATAYGHYEAAEVLLNAGADIGAREKVDAESFGQGVSVMYIAAVNKDYQMVELLLKHGCDINEKAGRDGQSPFLIAINSNDRDYMEYVLRKGANVDIERYNGETALIHAVLTRDQNLAQYLLEKGADINHRNITGLSALEIAKSKGFTDMAQFLITLGATDSERMVEHLVAFRQDFYWWDNDIAFAYYHWTSDDGYSNFLIYGIGYLDRYLRLSAMRRFYIRKKGTECVETYAGDDHHWIHYTRTENGRIVNERFDDCGHNTRVVCELSSGIEKGNPEFRAANSIEPEQSTELDFEVQLRNLSEFFFQYVSIYDAKWDSEIPVLDGALLLTKYSQKAWDFLGESCERASVNVENEHLGFLTDVLLRHYIN